MISHSSKYLDTEHNRLDETHQRYGQSDPDHRGVHVAFMSLAKSPNLLLIPASGGLEMLFSDQRKHTLSIPAVDETQQPSSVAYLIRWLCENLMRDPRKEMFVLDDSV